MLKHVSTLIVLLIARPLVAQVPALPPPSATPESVVTVFLSGLTAGDWKSSTRLMDSAETAHFSDIIHRLASKPGVASGLAQAWHITEAEVQSLSPSDLLAAIMQVAAGSSQATGDLLKTASYTILGRVDEGADQAHIVIRTRISVKGVEVSTTEVRSLRRSAVGWRIELPAEMKGLIAGFEAAQ